MSSAPVRSRWSDVHLSAVARGISFGGDLLAATTLTLALQSAGAGGPAVSALVLATFLPLVMLAPLTGRLVDRVDSRLLLVTVGLAQVTVATALAYAGRLAVIVALVGLLSCGLAVTQPVLAALLPAMVHQDDLPQAVGITKNATSIAALAAPGLAGFMVGQFGARVPLLVNAASYLAIVAAGLLIRTRHGGTRTPTGAGPSGPDQRRGLTQDPLLRTMTLAVAGTLTGVSAINVIAVFFVRDTLGASATMYGLVTTTWTAGLLGGTWLLSRTIRRVRSDATLVRSALAMLAGTSAVILAAAAVPSAFWMLPLWVVGGALNGGQSVICNVVIGRRVAPELRGRAFATYTAAAQGTSMVGYFTGGQLLELVSPRPLVAFTGLAGVLTAALFMIPLYGCVKPEAGPTTNQPPGPHRTHPRCATRD